MSELFAHSERVDKPFVRYLRGDIPPDLSYKGMMELRIKELRKERGWTVEHLAEIVGLSKSYVSEIENGKKQANQIRIQKFADAFGIPVLALLDASSLGEDERALLSSFSRMTPEQRQTLISVARGFSD